MRNAALGFVFLFSLLAPSMSIAAVVPLKNIVCATPPPHQTDHDYSHLSFFDKTLNLGGYVPTDLTLVDTAYVEKERMLCLRENAYRAFIEMNEALQEETKGTLYIRSAFRTYEIQEDFKEEKGIYAAEAGRSEHQLGTAVDLIGKDTTGTFADSKEFKWMEEHAHEYGFVQSYQAKYTKITGTPAEAWHWRYVGVESALEIKESGLDPNVYLYGLMLVPEMNQSYQALPQTFPIAHSASSLLLQRES